MNCGPSGIMIMKSTMCVNCTAASVSSSGSSRGACDPAADAGASAWVSVGDAGKSAGGRNAGPARAGSHSELAVD